MVPVPDQARSTVQKEQEVTVPNLPLLRAHKMAKLGALWVPSKRSQGTFGPVWSSHREPTHCCCSITIGVSIFQVICPI